MFENKIVKSEGPNRTYYTRYIASWIRSGGDLYFNTYSSNFANWLRDVEKLTEQEIDEICLIAENGKMELETSAASYIQALNIPKEDVKKRRLQSKGFV